MPTVTLQTVEIPGYREKVKRERTLRDCAFLGGDEIVCGVVVRQLSLRTMLFLEHAQNGLLIPFRFDDENEILAHSLQVLYFSQPNWKVPSVEFPGFFAEWIEATRQQRFMRKVLRTTPRGEIYKEVREWIGDAMFDCPSGGGGESNVPKQSYASYPAHLVDLFATANLPFTYDEIMDMPLKRLWQHWRLAANRVADVTLTNPSDETAVHHLAKVGP